MDMFSQHVLVWLALSSVLIILEFIIPGAILSFLGIAGLGIAVLVHYGYIDSVLHAIIYWMILSLILVFFLRSFVLTFMPGDIEVGGIDEDEQMIGTVVKVVEGVTPESEGRVKYLDSTWIALSDVELSIGESAVIQGRDGNKLIIGKIN